MSHVTLGLVEYRKAFHANLSPFRATKLVAMAMSLDLSSPNF